MRPGLNIPVLGHFTDPSGETLSLEGLDAGHRSCQQTSDLRSSLMLDSRVLRDQKLNKRVKQRFASLSDVVHKLKAT